MRDVYVVSGAQAQRPESRGNGSRGPAGRAGPAGVPPPPPDEDPDPADEAAPEGLTGMDLIERELGGRVIEEIG